MIWGEYKFDVVIFVSKDLVGIPKRTTLILQLANRSIIRPERMTKDVLVQVGSLIFMVDFVVLDFEPDP